MNGPTFHTGQQIAPLEVTPSARDLIQYSVSSGDYYEAHYDADYARAHGLPGVLVHGLLKMAYLGRAVTAWLGPDAFIRSLKADYRGLDLVGHPFRVEGEVTDVRTKGSSILLDIDLRGISESGAVSTPGSAVVEVPAPDPNSSAQPSTTP